MILQSDSTCIPVFDTLESKLQSTESDNTLKIVIEHFNLFRRTRCFLIIPCYNPGHRLTARLTARKDIGFSFIFSPGCVIILSYLIFNNLFSLFLRDLYFFQCCLLLINGVFQFAVKSWRQITFHQWCLRNISVCDTRYYRIPVTCRPSSIYITAIINYIWQDIRLIIRRLIIRT